MKSSTLLPILEGLHIESLAAEAAAIVIRIATVKEAVACPCCGHSSGQIHSRYQRILADLPWNQVAVRIHLRVRKFFCANSACARRIFAEPLPELAARYARKTQRLQDAFYLIGYALGGRAGARVAVELGLAASPDTLLRRVREVTEAKHTLPTDLRIVGVDDWAFRKGHRYGTILIDLQRRRLVDLLPDRSSESLATWLKQHADLEVLSRDRAGVYADGARQGASQADQVADRWHLLRNVGEAMERLTAQHTPHLRQAAEQMAPTVTESERTAVSEPTSLPRAEQRRLARCDARETLYKEIKERRQRGVTIETIAKQVGVSKRTVQRFVRAEQFPARARRRRQSCQTAPYEAYLRQRLAADCQNAAQLYREVKEQGYSGGYSSIYKIVQRLADASVDGGSRRPLQKARSPVEVPPSRRVAWWLQGHLSSKPEEAAQQKAFLEHLYALAPVLKEAGALAKEFARLLKKRQGAELENWLAKAGQSACQEMRLFAAGIRQDLAAVRNAMTVEWSNGQTEGQVNRLKMLKRQMYGRANFDLLRARVLPMAKAA